MKYKVGDKVKIRKDLEEGVQYGSEWFTNLMCKLRGKETTITKVLSKFYTLKVDDGMWSWSEEMLEPICDFNIGDKVIFNSAGKNKLTGVFTISEINTDLGIPYFKLKEMKECTWFHQSRFFKVPLFKVGQIVQFKNIKEDKWYPGTMMDEIESELGVVAEVKENYYTANKPYQDGCLYIVKALQNLQKGETWHVTSASLKSVVSTAVSTLEDVKSVSQDDPGPIGDDGALAIAQTVDNVKGPQFKIGDVVVIRDDLVPGKNYIEWGGWNFLHDMAQHRGKVAKIIDYGCDDTNYLRLDIDDGRRSWITNSLLPYTSGSDYDLDKTLINKQQTKQNYENRLQESDSNLIRGSECKGRGVRYQENKAQIVSGHSCYTGKAVRC